MTTPTPIAQPRPLAEHPSTDCAWCGRPLPPPRPDRPRRRYCCRHCTDQATAAWHRFTNAQQKRAALTSPSCRLPEAERLALLAQVDRDIRALAPRLGAYEFGSER